MTTKSSLDRSTRSALRVRVASTICRSPRSTQRIVSPEAIARLAAQGATDHARAQDDLEGRQLGGDGGGLAEKDARRVEAGQAEVVARPVRRLDRERTLDGEQGAEQDRDPEQAGSGLAEDAPVRVQGEREQDQHEQGEGADLVGGHPRPQFDAQVLAGHDGRVTPHRRPPQAYWPGPGRRP